MQKPLARVLERQPAPLAEPLDDALDAEVGDAREETAGTSGNGEVDDVAEVAEQAGGLVRNDGLPPGLAILIAGQLHGRRVVGQGADHREGRDVDANGLEAGNAEGLSEHGDRLAAGGHDHDVHLAAAAHVRVGLEGLPVENGVLE